MCEWVCVCARVCAWWLVGRHVPGFPGRLSGYEGADTPPLHVRVSVCTDKVGHAVGWEGVGRRGLRKQLLVFVARALTYTTHIYACSHTLTPEHSPTFPHTRKHIHPHSYPTSHPPTYAHTHTHTRAHEHKHKHTNTHTPQV